MAPLCKITYCPQWCSPENKTKQTKTSNSEEPWELRVGLSSMWLSLILLGTGTTAQGAMATAAAGWSQFCFSHKPQTIGTWQNQTKTLTATGTQVNPGHSRRVLRESAGRECCMDTRDKNLCLTVSTGIAAWLSLVILPRVQVQYIISPASG